MTWFLTSLPTAVLILLVVGMSVLLSLAGLVLVRSHISHVVLAEHNDVAGFIFGIMGALYAVILAFIAIAIWEDFADTERMVALEAASVLDIFHEAEAFPDPARTKIQAEVREYALAVRGDEWQQMAAGQVSQQAEQALQQLWSTLQEIDPQSPRESNWHVQTLGSLETLARAREERIVAMKQVLPGIVWMVLVLGAALTITYTYLYGLRLLVSQAILTAAMGGMIGLVIALIIALDHPFTGPTSVAPNAFEAVLVEMTSKR